MALFGKKKVEDKAVKPVKTAEPAKEKKATAKKAEKVSAVPAVISGGATPFVNSDVIIRPRITEKSGMLSQQGVYTFEITRNANKVMIASAIRSSFKVVPVKIAIVNLPAKKVFIRGRRGSVPGIRKALVTLKKGDKIDFV